MQYDGKEGVSLLVV